jgi:hypothetical protein
VSYGRVDFHRVEPKGAIPIDRDNLSVGKGQRSGDSKGNANAETAESASIQIGSGLQTDAGKAQQIAAIGDRDIVLCDTVADGVENRQRVDIAVCAELRGRGGLAFGDTLLMFVPEPVEPSCVALPRIVAECFGESVKGQVN